MVKQRNPTEPIATVVQAMFLLWLTFAVFTVIGAFRGGAIFGWGRDDLCLTASSGLTEVADNAVPVRPGTGAIVTEILFCDYQPTSGQRLAWTLTTAPSSLLYLAVLVLALLLIRSANRRGVHTAELAGRLRLTGWFLLAGSLITSLVEAFARANFLNATVSLRPGVDADLMKVWDFPAWPVVIACVLLSFARITRLGNVMREDLEGTV